MTTNGERLRSSAAPDSGRPHSLTAVAKDAASDLLDLIGAQIRLVRAELSGEVRAGLSRIARISFFSEGRSRGARSTAMRSASNAWPMAASPATKRARVSAWCSHTHAFLSW